MKIRQIY